MTESGQTALPAELATVWSLPELQNYLVTEAKSARNLNTFAARNDRMAKAVGVEAASLAAKSLNKPEADDKLRDIFTRAAAESGQTFAPTVDENGQKLADKSAEYEQAKKAAGGISLKYLPESLEAVELSVDIIDILRNVDFTDVLRLTALFLGQPVPALTPEQIKESLHKTAPEATFFDQIDSLSFDGQPLTEQEEQGLNLAVRLANVTWKVAQVHRAIVEGDDRLDPTQREGVFNPYDLLIKTQFDNFAQRGNTPEEALIRVAFEIYKDVIQYKPLVTPPSASA